MTTTTEPTVADVVAFVVACWHDGLPTSRSYVARRLTEAGITVADDIVTRGCSTAPVPYRAEARQC